MAQEPVRTMQNTTSPAASTPSGSTAGLLEFRRSTVDETDRNWAIISQARQFLKDQGVDQWQNEYPNRDSIRKDLMEGNGYVITENGGIIAYACISFQEEACYKQLRGAWKSARPYAVIHRMAIDNAHKGKGVASLMLCRARDLCLANGVHSIRIDTDPDNSIMKHLLEKNGYEYCGVVTFDNSDKIAFEKLF